MFDGSSENTVLKKLVALSFVLAFGASAALPVGDVGDAESSAEASASILDRYLTASREQQTLLRGMSMEVDIDARLPRLKREGRLRGLRYISRLGRITYDALRFEGDSTVKKEVIARYLSAETQAQQGPPLGITQDNYKFKYKNIHEREGRRVHIFQLTPKRKQVGLFKGELWLEVETCLPLRESGRWVKSPSLMVKKVEFVREYEIRNGVAVPRHLTSFVETRIVGRAELNIQFYNFSRDERAGDEREKPVLTAQ